MTASPGAYRGGTGGSALGPRSPLLLYMMLATTVALCSCRMKSPPVPTEEPPKLIAASADVYSLARLHPAWVQAEIARRDLGGAPALEEAILEELARRELLSLDEAEAGGSAPGEGPESGPPKDVDVGPTLESILDRHYRRPPRDPISGDGSSAVTGETPVRSAPPASEWASAAESEVRQHVDLTYRGEMGAGATRDPDRTPDDLTRLTRLLELEADEAEARARSEWRDLAWETPEMQAVGEEPDAPLEGNGRDLELAVARDIRLREIARELAAAVQSRDDFRGSLERLASEYSPDQPVWSELSEGAAPADPVVAMGDDPLDSERLALIERYVGLLQTIIESTRRDSQTLARSAGLDLRFDGSAPDHTAQVADLLARFYGRARIGTDRAGEIGEP